MLGRAVCPPFLIIKLTMTTTLELNEELVKEALSLTDFQTEKELIEFALQVWSLDAWRVIIP